MKNILVVGSGARENAIINGFVKSSYKTKLFCYSQNMNPYINDVCEKFMLGNISDNDLIVKFAQQNDIDFAFIGPENPLANGVVDALETIGVKCVGPNKILAQIESSKSFARDLITKYNIDANPIFKHFDNLEDTINYTRGLDFEYVIKDDGLCGGKGVMVFGDHFTTQEEAEVFMKDIFDSNSTLVIEEKLIGQEFSLISFTDGVNCLHTIPVQDHKRLLEGDLGPNTGGMGSYNDANESLPFINQNDIDAAHKINEDVVKALKSEYGQEYKGVLYGGFIKTKNGVKVIEYNSRFGDPEAMNILTLLETDLVDISEAIIKGSLNQVERKFSDKASVCKYLVPVGYPTNSKKGFEIIIPKNNNDNIVVFQSSVDTKDGKLIAAGSRSVAVVGIGDTIFDAEKLAQDFCDKIIGEFYIRKDIGKENLINQRINHMKKVLGK